MPSVIYHAFAGFTVNKATTTFMHFETGKLIHMKLGDCREAGRHSPRLEGYLTDKGLHPLRAAGVHMVEVISNASCTLIGLIGKWFPHLTH